MPSHSNSRYQRSSFQGLSIIEGERSDDPASTANVGNGFQLNKQMNERRRRSSSLAQSDQIRDLIRTTVEELTMKDTNDSDVGSQYKTAEDRLKEVLAEAKESGYSSERIFSILGKSSDQRLSEEELIPKQSFIEGLKKLGYIWNGEEELKYIIDRFDTNKDGMISMAEFQHYCYHDVPSVAWKAERQRMEKAADANDGAAVDESRFDIKEIMYSVGTTVHNTSKLFWKIDVSVKITLSYCSDLDVITMQIENAASNEEFKTLYMNKSDCAIDEEALEEAATLAVQTSDEKTNEGKDLLRENLRWEFYSNYLVARLQMTGAGDSYLPSLAKLHGDVGSLEIEKPSNVAAPQRRSELQSAGANGKSIEAEFQSKVKSFQRDSRSARTSRKSAQELSSIVESALNEILMEDGM